MDLDVILRQLALVFGVLLCAYAVVSFTLGTPSFLATVTSDSMKPTLERGDWVVLQKQPAYTVDDSIVFSLNPGNVYVHRVVAVVGSGLAGVGVDGQAVPTGYRTKGDANPYADGWTVPPDAVLGNVVVRIPRLGYLALWLDGR